MTALLLIFLSVIIFAFYGYFLRKRNYWKNKNVPHSKPAAVWGNFREYIFLKKFIGYVTQDLCREFPDEPYVGTFYGSEPALLLQDPELIKLVMTKDFYYFSSREVSKYSHKETFTQNLFFTYGDRWKVMRQNLTPVFSSLKMKNMFHLIEKCCYVFEELLDHETSMSKKIDVRMFISRFTMDCIGACAFGIDTKTMDKEPGSNPFFVIGHKILETSNTMALKWIGRGMWPFLFYGLGLKNFSTEASAFFKNILTNVFKGRDENSKRNDFIDFILNFKRNKYIVGDSMSNAKGEGSKRIQLEADDDFLVAQCLAFFVGGFETSSTVMGFTLFELAKNKEAQRRVQEEVDEYLKRHNNGINYEVVKELTYTTAAVDEAMRLYPVLAVVMRELVEEYTFPTGLKMEKGTRVHIPIYHMHHKPEYFPEPKKFKPERFLPEEKKNIKPYTFMPFGEGPRICIGSRFAKMQMMAGLVTILKAYDVDLAEDMTRDLEIDPRGIVTQASTAINLKFTPRDVQKKFTTSR